MRVRIENKDGISNGTTIATEGGHELDVVSADVHFRLNESVDAYIEAYVGSFDVVADADVRLIGVDGKRYRLVPEDEQEDGCE